eukprot:507993-Pyramimonas_sp.AAC.1
MPLLSERSLERVEVDRVGPQSLRPPPLCAGMGEEKSSDPMGYRRTILNTFGRLVAYCQNCSVGHRGTMKTAAVPTGWRSLHSTKCFRMSNSSENGPLQNVWRPPHSCLVQSSSSFHEFAQCALVRCCSVHASMSNSPNSFSRSSCTMTGLSCQSSLSEARFGPPAHLCRACRNSAIAPLDRQSDMRLSLDVMWTGASLMSYFTRSSLISFSREIHVDVPVIFLSIPSVAVLSV